MVRKYFLLILHKFCSKNRFCCIQSNFLHVFFWFSALYVISIQIKNLYLFVSCLQNERTNVVIYGNAHFGSGAGPIYFDDLVCNGYESDLFSCQHPPLGDHNCGHDEDAGVQCGENISNYL